jgi:diguanylate cyclase (GGDEF)-like protein
MAIEGVEFMDSSRRTESAFFFKSILDSLDHQIAVIDSAGEIVHVNKAWVTFGVNNGMPGSFDWRGRNYLQVCDVGGRNKDAKIANVADGIRRVLSGGSGEFEAEYPCHSPHIRRWFLMRIATMKGEGPQRYVISHTDITSRKIAEEELEALSVTDPLTGLANRRRLDAFLRNEWRRALRQQLPMSVIMLDIDHFKMLNDALGHAAGDACLRQIADVLCRFAKRPTDLAARYGGEEFVVVLANTPFEEAVAIANRIREAVLRLALWFGENRQLSISAGVSFTYPANDDGGGDLIEQADRNLYCAKRKGRNRVEAFGELCETGYVGSQWRKGCATSSCPTPVELLDSKA